MTTAVVVRVHTTPLWGGCGDNRIISHCVCFSSSGSPFLHPRVSSIICMPDRFFRFYSYIIFSSIDPNGTHHCITTTTTTTHTRTHDRYRSRAGRTSAEEQKAIRRGRGSGGGSSGGIIVGGRRRHRREHRYRHQQQQQWFRDDEKDGY